MPSAILSTELSAHSVEPDTYSPSSAAGRVTNASRDWAQPADTDRVLDAAGLSPQPSVHRAVQATSEQGTHLAEPDPELLPSAPAYDLDTLRDLVELADFGPNVIWPGDLNLQPSRLLLTRAAAAAAQKGTSGFPQPAAPTDAPT